MGGGQGLLSISLCLAFAVGVVRSAPSIAEVARLSHEYFTRRHSTEMAAFVCDEMEGLNLFRLVNKMGGLKITVTPHENNFTTLIKNRLAGVLLLTDCRSASTVLRKCSADPLLFNSSVMWLLVGEYARNASLGGLPIRLDSEVTLAQPFVGWSNDTKWDLTEVFRLDPNPELKIQPAGHWDPYEGFVPAWENCLTTRRKNITGVHVRTALFLERLQQSDEELNGLAKIDRRDKSLKEMTNMAKLNHLLHVNAVEMFNVSVKLLQHLDPGQLNPSPNESFFGILGMAERGEAEILASGMIMTLGRMRVISYPATLWRLRSVFIFLAPSALGSMEALSKPFSTNVWFAVFFTAAVVFLLDRLICSFENSDESWGSSMTSVIGTLTSQGFYVSVEKVPARILLLSFEVFCLITYGFYSAAVVTFLLRPPDTDIRTPRDMMKGHFKAAVHDWLHTVRSVSHSSDPLVMEVFEKMIKPPDGLGSKSLWSGGGLIRRPRTAFFGGDASMYQSIALARFTEVEICRLREVDLEPDLYVSLGLRKVASIGQYIRIALVVQLERGVANRELRIWQLRRPPCLEGVGHVTGSVGMEPIVPALGILFVGMCLSIVTFYSEVWRGQQQQ